MRAAALVLLFMGCAPSTPDPTCVQWVPRIIGYPIFEEPKILVPAITRVCIRHIPEVERWQ